MQQLQSIFDIYPNYAIMVRFTALCITLFSVGFLAAQDNTLSPDNTQPTQVTTTMDLPVYNRVLVIPFDPKLYMSGIDAKIVEETGLTYNQVRERMRLGLAHNVSIAVDMVYSNSVLLVPYDTLTQQIEDDLEYTYSSIGYTYDEIPRDSAEIEIEKKGLDKVVSNIGGIFKKDETEDTSYEPGTATIADGEVVTVPDDSERFMNTKIHNPNLFYFLSSTYQCDMFVFINQLDIEAEAPKSMIGLEANDYLRKIKVHYSIFNINGDLIHGGAVVTYFDTKTNDLNSIINGYFTPIAERIAQHLPGGQLDPAHQQKLEEEEEQADDARDEMDLDDY